MDHENERPRDSTGPDSSASESGVPAPRDPDRSPAVPSAPHDIRVGDAERHAAMRALDTHLEAGRLSVDEYGDRSAAAVVATVRSDLAVLFVDLPAPHPPLPDRAGAVAKASLPELRPYPHSPAVPAAAFAAIMMLMIVPVVAGLAIGAGLHLGGLFLLPLLFMTMGGVHRRRGGPHHQ